MHAGVLPCSLRTGKRVKHVDSVVARVDRVYTLKPSCYSYREACSDQQIPMALRQPGLGTYGASFHTLRCQLAPYNCTTCTGIPKSLLSFRVQAPISGNFKDAGGPRLHKSPDCFHSSEVGDVGGGWILNSGIRTLRCSIQIQGRRMASSAKQHAAPALTLACQATLNNAPSRSKDSSSASL